MDRPAPWRDPRFWRPLGPAIANPPAMEMLRASVGTGLALILCFGLMSQLFPLSGGRAASIFLVAPLAATAFLAFAVPSSPLAQPWSAVVGNTVSALIGVALVLVLGPTWLALGLSVTLSMMAMMRLRALHPPAAGVALGTVLAADVVREIGFSYAFVPVFMESCLLLACAAIYNRVTGRRFPFRQPVAHAPQIEGKVGLRPALDGAALEAILQRLQLDANIGAGDLERLIAAAHHEAATHLFDGVACRELMTRQVVALRPETPLSDVASIFNEHRVRTLPVTDASGMFLGLLGESDLLRYWRRIEQQPADRGVLSRLIRAGQQAAVPMARDAMVPAVATAGADTPLGTLIDLLAEGGQQGIPVLEGGRLTGFVTRADLIAALARAHHPEWG
ncbi:HPP family protein [Szabonella alba]|uniref:HPP family protein n=1 Tax=Szabonella alba TaxID=2804194 RepID=A0A8K0VFJ2_9RHOB|nr:HPP family protein [Szabonella alba]